MPPGAKTPAFPEGGRIEYQPVGSAAKLRKGDVQFSLPNILTNPIKKVPFRPPPYSRGRRRGHVASSRLAGRAARAGALRHQQHDHRGAGRGSAAAGVAGRGQRVRLHAGPLRRRQVRSPPDSAVARSQCAPCRSRGAMRRIDGSASPWRHTTVPRPTAARAPVAWQLESRARRVRVLLILNREHAIKSTPRTGGRAPGGPFACAFLP